MKGESHYEVAIIGAGPAGSSCATMLARAGVRVLLLDKSRFPREKICGDCINPKAWSLFRILGVEDKIHALEIPPVTGVRVHDSFHSTLEVKIPNLAVPFFAIGRREMDALLVNHAAEHGVQVQQGVKIKSIIWDRKWVIASSAGRTTAEYLVGADGRNSFVARLLGAKFLCSGRAGDRVGLQWHASYQRQIATSVEMFLFESGYCGVVNLDGGRSNVALVTGTDRVTSLRRDFDGFLERTIWTSRAARRRLDSLDPSGAIAAAVPVSPMTAMINHPRAFLAGDARQTVEPFTGEGVYFALQDGIETARRLAFRLGKKPMLPLLSKRKPMLANRISSSILCRPALANTLVAAGVRFPGLVPRAFRAIFPRVSSNRMS